MSVKVLQEHYWRKGDSTKDHEYSDCWYQLNTNTTLRWHVYKWLSLTQFLKLGIANISQCDTFLNLRASWDGPRCHIVIIDVHMYLPHTRIFPIDLHERLLAPVWRKPSTLSKVFAVETAKQFAETLAGVKMFGGGLVFSHTLEYLQLWDQSATHPLFRCHMKNPSWHDTSGQVQMGWNS